MAVGAASRGRGVGSALVARALQEIVTSSRRPPGEVLLHVDPERKGALRMYQRRVQCGAALAAAAARSDQSCCAK